MYIIYLSKRRTRFLAHEYRGHIPDHVARQTGASNGVKKEKENKITGFIQGRAGLTTIKFSQARQPASIFLECCVSRYHDRHSLTYFNVTVLLPRRNKINSQIEANPTEHVF
jgi:hypothetical protein